MNYFYSILIFCQITNSLQSCDQKKQGKRLFLIEAVKQNNTEVVYWLLNQEASTNVQDDEGNTALIFSVQIKNTSDIITLLVDFGANVNIQNNDGKTVFHTAAEYGNCEALKLVVNYIYSLHSTDKQHRSALHFAAMSNSEETLNYLVEKGLDVYSKDIYGFTPLHTAAMLGNVKALAFFNQRGISMDLVTTNGTTPLILATLFEKTDSVKFLLRSGVNINSHDNNGWSALHAAAYSGVLEIVKMIVAKKSFLENKNFDGRTPLFLSVSQGHEEVALYLIDQGANYLTTDKENNTLVHAAAESGAVKLIELLKSKNVRIDALNKKGMTPVLTAAYNKHQESVKYLIESQADFDFVSKIGIDYIQNVILTNNSFLLFNLVVRSKINVSKVADSSGATLLHYAIKHSNLNVVKCVINVMAADYLKTKNFKVENEYELEVALKFCLPCYENVLNVKDYSGKTPLHYAILRGDIKIVEYLLKYGVRKDFVDNDGVSPFHTAADLGYDTIFFLLVMNYPQYKRLTDNQGKTVAYHAVEFGNMDTLKFLIDDNVDVNIKDNNGSSLLHAAVKNNRDIILTELLSINNIKEMINDVDNMGKSPLWYAISMELENIISILNMHKAKVLPEFNFCLAAETNDLKAIKYYFSMPKKPVIRNCSGGKSLLHIATLNGHHKLIDELGKYACLVNSLDESNKTPAYYAVLNEKWDILQQLQKIGGIIEPNVTIIDAVDNDQIGFVKYLVKTGSDVNTKTQDKAPILFRAAIRDNVKILDYLIQNGADIEATYENQGTTSLHIAANKGSCNAVDLLLSKGAKVNTLDEADNTPLDDTNISCKGSLLKYGAKYSWQL